uniref:Uncharacterized protein n=1 Tax=Globodera rostochiensis TaxID=31243 RepID=A0A914H5T4_GLORO
MARNLFRNGQKYCSGNTFCQRERVVSAPPFRPQDISAPRTFRPQDISAPRTFRPQDISASCFGPKTFRLQERFGPKTFRLQERFGPKTFRPQERFGPKTFRPRVSAPRHFGSKNVSAPRHFGSKNVSAPRHFGSKNVSAPRHFGLVFRPQDISAPRTFRPQDISASSKPLSVPGKVDSPLSLPEPERPGSLAALQAATTLIKLTTIIEERARGSIEMARKIIAVTDESEDGVTVKGYNEENGQIDTVCPPRQPPVPEFTVHPTSSGAVVAPQQMQEPISAAIFQQQCCSSALTTSFFGPFFDESEISAQTPVGEPEEEQQIPRETALPGPERSRTALEEAFEVRSMFSDISSDEAEIPAPTPLRVSFLHSRFSPYQPSTPNAWTQERSSTAPPGRCPYGRHIRDVWKKLGKERPERDIVMTKLFGTLQERLRPASSSSSVSPLVKEKTGASRGQATNTTATTARGAPGSSAPNRLARFFKWRSSPSNAASISSANATFHIRCGTSARADNDECQTFHLNLLLEWFFGTPVFGFAQEHRHTQYEEEGANWRILHVRIKKSLGTRGQN